MKKKLYTPRTKHTKIDGYLQAGDAEGVIQCMELPDPRSLPKAKQAAVHLFIAVGHLSAADPALDKSKAWLVEQFKLNNLCSLIEQGGTHQALFIREYLNMLSEAARQDLTIDRLHDFILWWSGSALFRHLPACGEDLWRHIPGASEPGLKKSKKDAWKLPVKL